MINACVDSGIIDCMQVWFSYNDDYTPEVQAAFARASKAGIGMTAMKMNAHGRGKMGKDAEKQKEMKAEGMIGRCARPLRDDHQAPGRQAHFPHLCIRLCAMSKPSRKTLARSAKKSPCAMASTISLTAWRKTAHPANSGVDSQYRSAQHLNAGTATMRAQHVVPRRSLICTHDTMRPAFP